MKKMLLSLCLVGSLFGNDTYYEGDTVYLDDATYVDSSYDDQIFFTGFSLGKTKGKVSVYDKNNKKLDSGWSDSVNSYEFKVGQDNGSFRGYFSYSNIDGETDIYGVNFDQYLGGDKFRPFVGLALGYYDEDDVDGYVYGGRVGLSSDINEQFILEAQYSYLWTSVEFNVDFADGYRGELDNIGAFGVGVNFKF